jgi:glycosyltransferase involved in cell wall biosynthesis
MAAPDRSSIRRTVVLPARNESGYIAEMVARTIAACERRPESFEVIVVDNASEDATASIVSEIAARDPRVRLIVHPENRLYAGSCQTAMRAARGERVFILDSDGQHDPADVWVFDAAMDTGLDLVFGWRRERQEPPQRMAMSKVLLWLTKVQLGYPLHDVNCGIRGISRRYVDAVEIRHRVNFVNPELYVRARLAGMSIGEVPVRQEARKAGVSSHDFRRLWQIFVTVERYLQALRRELRAKGAGSPASP